MKALLCGYCGDIRALGLPTSRSWVSCDCGNTVARWIDPERGTAEFRKGFAPDKSFVLGLNNRLLVPALEGRLAVFEDFRAAHERATDAPNHVFDASRAGCWAVVVRVGTTSDVSWAEAA